MQRKVGHITASQLEKLFNTSVSIKNVNLGLFNQLIIEGIDIEDQQQKPMLHIDKLAASLEYLPLFEGRSLKSMPTCIKKRLINQTTSSLSSMRCRQKKKKRNQVN